MSKRFKIAAAILFAGAAVASTATVASAHTVTVPRPVPVNWQFDVSQLNISRGPVLPDINVNNVEGRGALLMRGWQDVSNPNPRLDTFRLGVNSVTLRHSPLRLANFNVNPYTCTVDVSQSGRFVIVNGTGTGRNLRVLRNSGRFELEGQLSYPLTPRGLCVLRLVGTGAIIRAVQSGSPILGVNPNQSSFSVQGRALVTRTVPVIRPFAPTATPSA